jgi:hypothetical protein
MNYCSVNISHIFLKTIIASILSIIVLYTAIYTTYAQDQKSTTTSIIDNIDNTISKLEGTLVPTEDISEKFTGKDFTKLPWRNSIMFNQDELEYIYKSLNSRISGKSATSFSSKENDSEDIISIPQVSTPEPIGPSVAPAFYLNSMLFYNANNWTIWVNHRRIRRNTKLNRLQIGRITKDYVEFIWKPLNLDIISPNWLNKVSPIAEIYSDTPLLLQEENNNLQGELDKIEVPKEDQKNIEMETIKSSAPQNKEKSDDELDLPPLFIQEEFSINISKLITLLKEERKEIADKKAAEEAVRLARQAEKVEGESEKYTAEAFDAFKDKEIPYLWDYKSPNGNILIDTINGVVKFRIGINQTFVSRTMEIVEGKVKSTILSSATQETQELRTQDLERAIFEQSPNK